MQANERTARVLLVFAGADDALGVTEIARRLGLGKSTVHRALEGLVASGIVMRDPVSSLYRLGPRAIELGLRAIGAADIRALALPCAQRSSLRPRRSLQVLRPCWSSALGATP